MNLCAIAIDPRNHYCFAVAGGDEYVRLYDARKIEMERSKFGLPVEQFCPQHLVSEKGDVITGLAYSQTGELLASYRNDNIYLFEREHGLYFNDFDEFHSKKLPVPQSFKGHLNMQVVKGVSFLGPNCEYVTSGSDCGHVFIWRKKDGKPVRVMKGDTRIVNCVDTRIVNCVEQHPHEIVIASCGINTDVKIWAPGDNENPSTALLDEVCSYFTQILLCFTWIVIFFVGTACQIWCNVSRMLALQ